MNPYEDVPDVVRRGTSEQQDLTKYDETDERIAPHASDSYPERFNTPNTNRGLDSNDYDGYDRKTTGPSDFNPASASGVGEHDSAETRFGVERPEKMNIHSEVTAEDPLASDSDRHSSSIAVGQLGRGSTYVTSDDPSFAGQYNTSDTTDTGLHQPAETVGYGRSEGHSSFGDSRVTSTHDSSSKSGDSTMGKLMEKAGDVLNKEDLAEKGRAKREAAVYEQESSKSDY